MFSSSRNSDDISRYNKQLSSGSPTHVGHLLRRHRASSAELARAELSHLLDPSYSGSSASPPRMSGLYVDQDGQLHDPDYRPFAPLPPRRRARRAPRTAPTWGAADSDTEDEEAMEEERARRREREATSQGLKRKISRGSLYPATPAQRRAAAAKTPVYAYSSAPYPAPSNSYQPYDKEWRTEGMGYTRAKLRSHRGVRTASTTIGEDYVPSMHNKENSKPVTDKDEFTPTCTDSFRRKWAALSLRVRFGVYRTQRKIRRRVGL